VPAPNAERPTVRTVRISICCLALAWAATAPGCNSAPALDSADGSSLLNGHGDDAAGADVGACPPPIPTSPCRVDSDCKNRFLVCESPTGGVFVCRDPEAVVDLSCPSPQVDTSKVPSCPATVPVPYSVCQVRYQLPCAVDKDCGPAGFTCVGGRCQGSAPTNVCATAADCPTGWECYAPCACPGVDAGTVCEPPFAVFGCPACGPAPGP